MDYSPPIFAEGSQIVPSCSFDSDTIHDTSPVQSMEE